MFGMLALALAAATLPAPDDAGPRDADTCAIELVVLGTAQDAGAPQLGNPDDPAWRDPSLRRLAASLALIDRRTGRRFLFEATPDLREQLERLDRRAPHSGAAPGLDGIFLTHAHIGHYAGLIFLGHESVGAQQVPVFAMPRMRTFLSTNGPWDQLVAYRNIALLPLAEDEAVTIGDGLTVTPHAVPHRDEYSETVGFVIRSPGRSVLFLPDIDSWDRWEAEQGVRIEDMIRAVDIAYVDATFFDDNEIPGRDMSTFPHPRIAGSMERFARMGAAEAGKIRFIHLNHTNPARFPDSAAARAIRAAGFAVAAENDAVCLFAGTDGE